MKFKFNRMERIAGLFVLVSLTGTVFATVGIIVKKGFFEPKVSFITYTRSSDSIRPGTPVQMAGLRAGSVREIELGTDGQVKVEFVIFKKYVDRVRADSRLELNRPSLISERVLEITMGSEGARQAAPGSLIRMSESEDAIDVLSGKRLAALIDHVDQVLVGAAGLVQQVSHGNNLQRLMTNLRDTSDGLRKSVSAEDLGTIVANLSKMSGEFAAVSGQIKSSSENLPESARKMDELLTETSLLVKGIQRSWMFRGGVNDAREEGSAAIAAAKKAAEGRAPAAEGKAP